MGLQKYCIKLTTLFLAGLMLFSLTGPAAARKFTEPVPVDETVPVQTVDKAALSSGNTGKASVTADKVPGTTEKAPVTTEKAPVPADKVPETTKKASVPADKAQETTGKASATADKAPETTGKAPVPADKAQETTGKASATADKVSATADKVPETTEKAPVSTDKAPGTTDKASATADKVPETTEKAPVSTDKAPGTTGKAPVPADKVPETTEKAPVTAEKAPEATEKAPVTPDKVPETTEKTPETADKVPETTEKAPGTTDNASGTTDKVPETADKAPGTVDEIADEPFADAGSEHPLISDFQFSAAIEDAGMPLTQLDIPESDYFKDFGYSDDIVLSGIYQTNKYFFQAPAYWDCQYAYARLEVELSQLIQDVPASLTFLINGVPITSYKMDYRSGSVQTFYVEIPLDELMEGYNSFEITGYVRIYDDEGCLDDFSGANWICIRRTSFIQVGYNVKPHNHRISVFPYPFMSTIDESGSTTTVFVSDKCLPSELEAALMLRAGLGSETSSEDAITLARLSDRTGQEKNAVIVSLRDNLDSHYRALADNALGGADLTTQAMVAFVTDGGVETLLITSDNEKCLREAAMMLLDESRVTQERSNIAFVREDASAPILAQLGNNLEAGRLTLDSLLDSGLTFVGPFHQVGDIYLPFSGGFVLADSGNVSLKFRYSENLDFRRSVVTVFWGDIPVASKKLSKELASGDEFSFAMPEDVVGTHAGKISIAFDLELPDLFCTPRLDEMPWAYVTDDSSFYLPVGTSGNYTFDQRPYPFERSSSFNALTVVIPERITQSELNLLGRLITIYGESPSPYGDLNVVYADSITEEDKNNNLITIGTFTDNSLIRELNDKLHFQYSDTGVSFQSNDVLALSDGYAREIATMQLMSSPYTEERAVLVVGAVDDQGVANLHSFLQDPTNLWKLEKDTVLIDSEQNIRTFELSEKQPDVSTPILKKMLDTNREAAVFTIVATAVMLLFLLTAVLILIRIYWRQKK